MKVILLKDVPKIGRQFEVKHVADGYAANFLFPKKLAEPATSSKVRELEQKKNKEQAEFAAKEEKLLQQVLTLKEKVVIVRASANEQGHLFKGIKVEDVAKVLQKEHGITFPKQLLQLEHPIKEVGDHTVTVMIGGKEHEIRLAIEGE